MAETTSAAVRAGEPSGEGLLAAREVDLRRAIRVGLVGGIAAVFVASIGMVVAFEERRIVDGITLSLVLLAAIPFLAGSIAATPPPQLEGFAAPHRGPRNLAAGALAGLVGGLVVAVFLTFVGNVNVRSIFVNVSPEMIHELTFGQALPVGVPLAVGFNLLLGLVAGALHLLEERVRRAALAAVTWILVAGMLQSLVSQVFRSLRATALNRFLYGSAGGLTVVGAIVVAAVAVVFALRLTGERNPIRERLSDMSPAERRNAVSLVLAIGVVVLAVLPLVLGRFMSEVLDQAMIFMLMALGLNIVVGFAGLLDLGYVAFFAVGAYTAAVLTSPLSPGFSPELTFLAAIPFVMLAAAVAGILVGTPVLRMRGDYLAIVTLGFGEIARLLAQSDWLKGVLGGAQGIILIPNVQLGPIEVTGPQGFFWGITFFAILAAYVSYALQGSRIGRAWMAMREDESVAEAMGVNTVAAKLWAFVIGAVLASFGGALFATKVGAIFPNSFRIVTSITILVIVIVGGLGSPPGVVLGALALVGLPELLREFQEFRFLIYGALLIFMMIKRPEGFIPSKRRAQELHEEEVLQDAWLRRERQREEAAEPAEAG